MEKEAEETKLKTRTRATFLCLTLFMGILLMFGCARQEILDKLGMLVIIGYDKLKDDRILGSFVFHQIDPEAEKKAQMTSSTAFTTLGIRQSANLQMAKKYEVGQLRIAMYSDKIAKEGLMKYVNTLERDPEIGTTLFVVIGKGKVNEILGYKYPQFTNIGRYLYELIKQNIEGEQLPSATLHEFLHTFYSDGVDPMSPFVSREGEILKVDKVAVFNGDKMVGTIKVREAFFVKLIRGRFKTGRFEFSMKSDDLKKYLIEKPSENEYIHAVADTLSSKSKIKLVDSKKLEFDVEIKVQAAIKEVAAYIDLSKPEAITAIEKGISLSITNESEKLIKRLQKLKSDPIGFGEHYLASVRGSKLTREEWHKKYSEAKINVKVKTTLVRTGIAE